MEMKFTVDGTDRLVQIIENAGRRAVPRMKRLLYAEAQEIMTNSRPLVPHHIGTLRGSGTVGLPHSNANVVQVEFGYGGAASAYAVVQHENLSFEHPRGGQAMFLEDAVRDAIPNMAQRLADGFRDMFT